MWAFVLAEVVVLAIVVTFILHIYISWKKTPWYAYISTWIGWFMCFSIVLLVPVDVIATDHDTCVPDKGVEECPVPLTYLNSDGRVLLWTILYWGTFILTWLVYPILQSYVSAGDFTVFDRLREAFRENLFIYVGAAVFGLAVIFYLLAVKQLEWDVIVGILMAAANAWGMFLLVVFMGIGLVDIPRRLFRHSNTELMMRYLKYEVATHNQAKKEAKDELFATLKLVRKISDRMRESDPLRPFVQSIISECPSEFNEVRLGEGDSEVSYGKLVSLHTKVKLVTANASRTEHLFDRILHEAFEYDDVARCRNAPSKIIDWSFKPPRTHRFATFVNHLEWFWYTHLATKVQLLLFLCSAILSVVIVWQEVTVSVRDPDLSVFSWMVKALHLESLPTQIAVFLPLGYEALTTYSTLFRLQLFHFYRLMPHQQTDPYSIMFSAAYLCRLAAPLSYNFMNFLHNQLAFSSFERVMGQMDVVSFLGKHFNVYFPILIAVVCLANLFDVYSKIAACFHIKRFRFDQTFNDSRIDEGRSIIDRERSRLLAEDDISRVRAAHKDDLPPVGTFDDDILSHIEQGGYNNNNKNTPPPSPHKPPPPPSKKFSSGGGGGGVTVSSVNDKRSPIPSKRPVFEPKPTSDDDDSDMASTSRWRMFGRGSVGPDRRSAPDERKLLGGGGSGSRK